MARVNIMSYLMVFTEHLVFESIDKFQQSGRVILFLQEIHVHTFAKRTRVY